VLVLNSTQTLISQSLLSFCHSLSSDGPPQQVSSEYKWCKCFFEPGQAGTQNYYFIHFDTRETQWEEPREPYWLWDAMTNNVHPAGIQHPNVQQTKELLPTPAPKSEPDPDYQGYNPKIHGNYDPNAPYAKFHEQKHAAEEQPAITLDSNAVAQAGPTDYTAAGTFNRFTGGFQTGEISAERHDDYNKSGRQLNAFFDVDAAANAHGGKSLKDERRQQKLSKKEIQELSRKRREKKEKKRLEFYRS